MKIETWRSMLYHASWCDAIKSTGSEGEWGEEIKNYLK